MDEKSLILGVLAGVGLLVYLLVILPQQRRAGRRRRLLNAPFPPGWDDILARNVDLYKRLPDDLRKELRQHIQVFLGEKRFEGCGGLKLTEEMRLTIAAFACVPLLNRAHDYYPNVRAILVYPGSFVADGPFEEGDVLIEESSERLGESWENGTVVLAWDEIRPGSQSAREGINVVLHEFAHQIDQESGEVDGVPYPEGHPKYEEWIDVMDREYERVLRPPRRRGRPVLDEYGLDDPSEFFAVAAEAFYERPRRLKSQHPALYLQFREFFRVDPAKW